MALASSYFFSTAPFDSETEPKEYNGWSYAQLMKQDFTQPGFEDANLVRYLGKGPTMENVILVSPSISSKAAANKEDSLKFLIRKLDKYCTSKYSLLICQTCTSWSDPGSYNLVSQWYDMLPKGHKKNLSKVYMIHSGYSTKTFLTLLAPFASEKLWKKIECVEKISDVLHSLQLNTKNMLRNFPYAVQRAEEIALGINPPISIFGTELWNLAMRLGRPFKGFPLIPPVFSHILSKLEESEIIDTEDLLNLQCDAHTLYAAVGGIEHKGEGYTIESASVAVSLFKLCLDTHMGGLIGPKGYITIKNAILQSTPNSDIVSLMAKVTSEFQGVQRDCVLCVIKTLRAIARRAQNNGMTVKKIAKLMAGSFFRPLSPDPYCYKAMQTGEVILATMIERPEIFFKKDSAEAKGGSSESQKKLARKPTKGSVPKLSKLPSTKTQEDLQKLSLKSKTDSASSKIPGHPMQIQSHNSVSGSENITEVED